MSYFRPSFTVTSSPVRVRFGVGIHREIASELESLNKTRALILTTPRQRSLGLDIANYTSGRMAGLFHGAQMHTPVDISQEATAYARSVNADVIISVGGGSTTGLGKAIALRTGLDQIVIPTTYSGSEATSVLGQTEHGQKNTQSSPEIQPEVILYDAQLVADLPLTISVASALNAMAHAIEGLYAQNRSPLSSLMAVEGINAFHRALPKVLAQPCDLAARGETLYGAWLCGSVLNQGGMALHHKLCHVLGGSLDLPHAATHAVILPHALAYNAKVAAEELRPLESLFGSDIAAGLYHFAKFIGAPMSLRELGMTSQDIDYVVRLATENPYWNPRPISAEGLRGLLCRAWDGSLPQT